jgi:glycosyltransferase involved in cell wall biosynthesis
MSRQKVRLAFVVSHPIQYFVPLYRKLARRHDTDIKVFFTWHAGEEPVEDRGFRQKVVWDIPLTGGYEFERVPNVSSCPGPYDFFGLRNPALLDRVMSWRPDVVHLSGWAWYSHLELLYSLHRRRVPTLFFGDSHLLDGGRDGPRSWLKCAVLRKVQSWPAGLLVVGSANRAYYERLGVEQTRLFSCPHSIDVGRFAEPAAVLEREAARWRQELGIGTERKVLLYAGKFEPKKRPTELMRAVSRLQNSAVVLVLVGSGELRAEINAIAAADTARFRVLPFANQSRMPVVYRLADIFVLPSAYGETWGLAVNEALACGRPVIVSDRVGCAADVVDPTCGRVFAWNDWSAFERIVECLINDPGQLSGMGRAASRRALAFDVTGTEAALVETVHRVCKLHDMPVAAHRPVRSMASRKGAV